MSWFNRFFGLSRSDTLDQPAAQPGPSRNDLLDLPAALGGPYSDIDDPMYIQGNRPASTLC
jgi:hypothetical protein